MSDQAKRFGLAVLILLLLPIAMLVGMLLGSASAGSNSRAAAVVMPMTPLPYDDRRGVQLTPTWTDGPSLVAPPWAGILGDVTEANIIRTGDPVAVVDGISRIAVATPQPFFRNVSLGDTGADVGWLHDFLVQRGDMTSAPARGVVTEETLAAISSLAADLGVRDAIASFDPAWVVWLPEDPFTVSTISVLAGQPAPGAGTIIATSPAILTDIAIQALDGGSLELSADDPYVLDVGGLALALQPDGTIDDASMDQLSAVLEPSNEAAQGTVHRANPALVWSVPTTAINAGPAGGLCVWVAEPDGYSELPVDVVSSQAGITYLVPGPSATEVLTNPADVLDEPSCPSA